MTVQTALLAVAFALLLSVGWAHYAPHQVRLPGAPLISYAGLVPINASNGAAADMFYWFFPAMDGNASAPLVLWLQGGPGCSGMLGLLYEHGPLLLTNVDPGSSDPIPALNSYTWAKHAHLLYIDNPTGVGFSRGPDVTDMDQMSSQLYSFLQNWFALYPSYLDKDFYIFGESYGGKYVPAIAAYVVQQNELGTSPSLNLVGIAIGNGITDPVNQVMATSFMADFGLISPLDLTKINAIASEVVVQIYAENWYAAGQLRLEIYSILEQSSGGVNFYDMRTFTPYNFTAADTYLNLPDIQALLHVQGRTYPGACINYESLENDTAQSVKPAVELLIAAGVRVLLYQGQFDLRDGVASNQAWIPTLSGFSTFDAIPHTIWTVANQTAGYARSLGVLTQLVVNGAGHLVAMNQPVPALAMVTQFLNGVPFS